jgi:gliding motility-associated-like protein
MISIELNKRDSSFYKVKLGLKCLLLFLLFSKNFTSLAQVSVQDSMALVALYNATNGANWTNKQNWLTADVELWHGLTIVNNRVQRIDLSDNNMVGQIPPEFCTLNELEYLYLPDNFLTGNLPSNFINLTKLNTIDFRNNDLSGDIPTGIITFTFLADLLISGNQFTQLPPLKSLVEISNVYIENNKFTFEDIEPNIGIHNFTYFPQDSVLRDTLIVVNIHDDVTLNSLIGGSLNQYQWKKNNQIINDSATHILGTATHELAINKVSLADSGIYHCVILNANVPLLSLTRRIIQLKIIDTRMDQEVRYIPGETFICGSLPIKLEVETSSGLPFTYTITKGSATIKSDSLFPYAPGLIFVKASHPGNETYKPVSRDTIIEIHPSAKVGLFSLLSNAPVNEGDSLKVYVTDVPSMSYIWSYPVGNTSNGKDLVVPNISLIQSGWYKIKVSENGCMVFHDSLEIVVGNKPLIKYYELITPDGDGKNEHFHIDNIELYPNNELTVFNSWNQILYSKKGYANDWTGNGLPSGSYFFIFKIHDQDLLIKGRIYIKR